VVPVTRGPVPQFLWVTIGRALLPQITAVIELARYRRHTGVAGSPHICFPGAAATNLSSYIAKDSPIDPPPRLAHDMHSICKKTLHSGLRHRCQ